MKTQPGAVGIEANFLQELALSEWNRQARSAGYHAAPAAAVHNTVAKEIRIRRIGPWLAGRRIRFNAQSASARELVAQLLTFRPQPSESTWGCILS